MSQFRLGLQLFLRDLRENPTVVMSGLLAAGATILILSAITGYHL